jgi:hypothetical protein
MDDRFIPHLKSNHAAVWRTLLIAAADGLVVIDEANDAVTATNRLLFTYPGLHDFLTRMTDEWAERHVDAAAMFKTLVEEAARP